MAWASVRECHPTTPRPPPLLLDRSRDLLRDDFDRISGSLETCQVREDPAVFGDLFEGHSVEDGDQRFLVQECPELSLRPEPTDQIRRRQQSDSGASLLRPLSICRA